MFTPFDASTMERALELARRGAGAVEPNPMVGCVIVRDGTVAGEGWHERYGGPHAEVVAIERAGEQARNATLYVTLEPCCHFGKTPPCSRAVIAAGVRRVVVAMRDPFPSVSGGGIDELRSAGIRVDVGLCEEAARELNAPYLKLVTQGRPWIIAKWAMSLDGKTASRTGDSRWISNEQSRREVHDLRGRVDAIVVGRGTVELDDPLLTARPPGPRVATRVILDRMARLSPTSRLALTARETPVLVLGTERAPEENRRTLAQCGCEYLALASDGEPGNESEGSPSFLRRALDEFGRRRWTNVLVEGGATLLGSLIDEDLLDEAWVYVAPKIIGGSDAPGAVRGVGVERVADARSWWTMSVATHGDDVRITLRRGQRGGASTKVATTSNPKIE